MFIRVGHEVHVERADPLLKHAPHRLAEVGHDPHEVDPCQTRGTGRSLVRLQEDGVLGRREAVVDREVPEIEERIPEARVLPVEDPDPVPVVDEIGIEQVVVAGPDLDR